jgi:hypothetical protein
MLKHFKVVERYDDGWAMLACPRGDCKKQFMVERAGFKKSLPGRATRPCPYCFRVSVVPGQKPPGERRGEDEPLPD